MACVALACKSLPAGLSLFDRDPIPAARLAVRRGLPMRVDLEEGQLPAFGLPQHPDDHRPQRPVLLAVDRQLGEGRQVSQRSSPLEACPGDKSPTVALERRVRLTTLAQ